MQHKLVMVGGGGGTEEYMLPIARKVLEKMDCVYASKRLLLGLHVKNGRPIHNLSVFLEKIPQHLEKESVGIIVSGDPLLYSLYRTITIRYPSISIDVIPGVGSLQLLAAAFGLTMEESKICSMHGREFHAGKIAYTVSRYPVTFFFCSKVHGPREIAKALMQYGLGETMLYVGADLTYPEQKLWHGNIKSYGERENPALCVAAVKNPEPRELVLPALLPDSAFIRNASPMTKEEIRAVILSKMRLHPGDVVWDLGAGTGSISVECARMCPYGQVYAVEYKAAALEVLKKNRALFSLEHLHIVAGKAEEKMGTLPVADCVFIGGSGGALAEIIAYICSLPKKIRLVISAVTLETQSLLLPLLTEKENLEVVQIAVSSVKSVGNYHMLEGNHPITIYSFETRA